MGKDGKGNVLRVTVTPTDIRQSYGIVSKFYGLQEGAFEKGLRQRGLEFLAVKESEIILKIGAGTDFSLREIARWVGVTGKVHGTDITSEMLKRTEKRLRKAGLQQRLVLTKSDARAMPY